MVTMDSAPPPCSHPLSSQKHAWFTTENFLGHFCMPETGSGQMWGEDSEKDTCLLGASQITKDLKPLILWILKIVSNYANGERRPTGTSWYPLGKDVRFLPHKTPLKIRHIPRTNTSKKNLTNFRTIFDEWIFFFYWGMLIFNDLLV